MPTSTITGTIRDGSGTPVAGVTVYARLRPYAGSRITDGSTVTNPPATVTNGSGIYSFVLEQQANISPNPTWWEIEEDTPDLSGGRRVRTVSVGASSTTVSQAEVTPAALVGPSALTQAQGDARYIAQGSFWVNAKNGPYGAKGDGVTDDTAAIQAAIDAVGNGGGGVVFLPPGSYLLSIAGTYTQVGGLVASWCLDLKENVTLKGAGTGATILVDNAQHTGVGGNDANVYTIRAQSVNSVGVEDLQVKGNAVDSDLAAGAAGFAVGFLSVTNFRLSNFYAKYMRVGPWTVGRERALDHCYQGQISNVRCLGYRMNLGYIACADDVDVVNVYGESREGFCIEGGPCNRINVSNLICKSPSVSTGLGLGIEVLANWGDMTAISIANGQVLGNFITLCRARVEQNGATFHTMTDVSFSNIHVNGNGQPGNSVGFGFVAQAGTTFDGLTVTNCIARNCTFDDGFVIDGPILAEFVNCVSENNYNSGFHVTDGAEARFVNCRAKDNNQALTAGVGQFHVDNTSTAWMIGCRALNATAGYGAVVASATDVMHVIECDFTGNTAGAVSIGASTDTIVRHCLGISPRGASVAQPAVAASGVAVTNTTHFDCMVVVAGGTVTVVKIGGTATGLTSGSFRVPAGQTIAITYTVAPTWVWFGD